MENIQINSKNSFLKMLNVSEQTLDDIILDKNRFYNKFNIPKKNGSSRTLYSINRPSELYTFQKILQNEIFSNILFPNFVYGFIKERSYFDYLVPHCSNSDNHFFLRLDIKNFFDSIKISNVYKALSCYFPYVTDLNEKDYIINSIIEICTYENKFVQGAVTSPSISNIAFKPIDFMIKDYCDENNIKYTRYADDMLFSANNELILNDEFVKRIELIISEYSFKLNHKKVIRMKDEISLNGYVVGKEIRFSRKKMHDINNLIFDLQNKSNKKNLNLEKSDMLNVLNGYKSYLIQLMKYTSDNKKDKISRKINIVSNLISTNFSKNSSIEDLI